MGLPGGSGDSPDRPSRRTGADEPPRDAAEREFTHFYLGARDRLLRQVAAVTGGGADAEDAVQEAFVRAAQHWEKIRSYDVPEAWVRRVAMRLAVDELRRGRRADTARTRLGSPADVPAPTGDVPLVVDAMRQVPVHYRQVLVLHYLVDLSVDEIADELDLPIGTVTARLTRGRHRLRAVLGGRPTGARRG